ncbi:MAG: type II toxin-antitoxin system YafQ family toxin [Pseudomonadota bacterium]
MLTLSRTGQFKRDLKKVLKDPKKDTDRLKQVINTLQQELPVPESYRDHLLKGNWNPHRECHIQPDFLLIYRVEGNELVLVRCGSHAELFG